MSAALDIPGLRSCRALQAKRMLGEALFASCDAGVLLALLFFKAIVLLRRFLLAGPEDGFARGNTDAHQRLLFNLFSFFAGRDCHACGRYTEAERRYV